MAKKAENLISELLVEMVREYKSLIRKRDLEISEKTCDIAELNHKLHVEQEKTKAAVESGDHLCTILDEVSKIIAGITEHTDKGNIRIYLSDITHEEESKLKRLFKLLDIPMSAEHIKDGDTDED